MGEETKLFALVFKSAKNVRISDKHKSTSNARTNNVLGFVRNKEEAGKLIRDYYDQKNQYNKEWAEYHNSQPATTDFYGTTRIYVPCENIVSSIKYKEILDDKVEFVVEVDKTNGLYEGSHIPESQRDDPLYAYKSTVKFVMIEFEYGKSIQNNVCYWKVGAYDHDEEWKNMTYEGRF